MDFMQEISPIGRKKQNVGQIKWRDRSDFINYSSTSNKDIDRSLNMERLFTTMSRKVESSQFIEEQSFAPVTSMIGISQTYSKKHQQNKLNQTVKNKHKSPYVKSSINSANSNFAIQSQPNELQISRSFYFNVEQTDYKARVQGFQKEKQFGMIKLFNVLDSIDLVKYSKRLSFTNLRKKCDEQKQIEIQSFQYRQLEFMDGLVDQEFQEFMQERNKQQQEESFKIPYYNKLAGLCNPYLVTKERQKMRVKQVEEIPQQQLIQQEIQPQKHEQQFVFNFCISPKPPLYSDPLIQQNRFFSSKNKLNK